MDLLTVLLLFTALSPASSSPVAPPGGQGQPAHQAERSEPFHLAVSATAPGPRFGHETPPTPTPAPASRFGADHGEQMKPILERRNPLNIGSPNDLSPVDTAVLQPAPGKGCTTTMEDSYPYSCIWDGTTTIYPSTTVMFQQVDCHGCDSVYVHREIYFCPNQVINATKTAGIPSTSWSTICRPSGLARRAGQATATLPDAQYLPTPRAEFEARNPQGGIQPPACPTTLVVQPERSAGKTSTSYSTYTTSTVTVNCGGCPLVISTALAGYGPPGSFVTTTTLPVGAKTTYACR
jgi:hypothetical protein